MVRLAGLLTKSQPEKRAACKERIAAAAAGKNGAEMIVKFFSVRVHTAGMDVVLFLFRLIGGYAFLQHGWPLIRHATTWMGPGSPVPGFLQVLAAFSEFGGAISWGLGLLTRLSALGIGCTMAVAVYAHLVILGDPFVSSTGGRSYELASVYLLVAVLLIVSGPGKISLDRVLFGKKK